MYSTTVFSCVACAVLVVVSALAPACDYATCKLPNCRCSSTDIPNSLKPGDVPQMVLLTFDDAVSTLLYNAYYEKLLAGRKNPNGCNIGITFFTSHEYCDYDLVQKLWSEGHEIAVHSITHKSDQKYWKEGSSQDWTNEMVGMRTILETHAKIPRADLKGIRAPFLQPGGNTQFKMMQDNGFLWDCSMPTRQHVDPGMWPYSLKHLSSQDCQIGPCPTDSFPNNWVVPMVDLLEKDGTPCAMLDTCRVTYANDTYDLLKYNFDMHYNGNRSPLGLYVHAAWFMQDKHSGHFDGYMKFLDYLKTKSEVYLVTVSQALAWTRDPKPLSQITSYAPWRTQCTQKPRNCARRTCKLEKKDAFSGGERYMVTCDNKCPPCYPWIGNPEGKC